MRPDKFFWDRNNESVAVFYSAMFCWEFGRSNHIQQPGSKPAVPPRLFDTQG